MEQTVTPTPSRAEIISALTSSGQFELIEDASSGYPLRIYRNAPASLREILLATQQYGDKPFLLYENEAVSFAQHYDKVASLARYLTERGVVKGDRVAIGMRNYPEWSMSFWACQSIGAIVVALNAWWTEAELEFALGNSTPAALLIDGERLARLRPLLSKFKEQSVVVARRGGAGEGGIDFAAVFATSKAELPMVDVGPDDLATILYTSGTTGKPKGAMATHRNHITNITNSALAGAVALAVAGLTEVPPDAPQPGWLQTFPFFHIGGLTGLYLGTAMGARMALMSKWVPAEAVRLIQTHGLTSASGVPIVVRQLLETAGNMGADLSTLVGITSGGAAVPPDLIRRIGEQFHELVAPGNGYGLTETTSAVIFNTGLDYLAHPESVGRPQPTADIRIVDVNGVEQPRGTVGELWVRGPNVIPGYWNNPEATVAAFGGGWFRTGDLGYVDADGFYYVVDRIKDVIIRGGENVYCAEVEAAILELPGVRDVAVVGLPHTDYGEEVAAVIQVAREDLHGELAEQIRSLLVNKLARYKIPTSVRLVDGELPRTATGKLLKREVRTRYF